MGSTYSGDESESSESVSEAEERPAAEQQAQAGIGWLARLVLVSGEVGGVGTRGLIGVNEIEEEREEEAEDELAVAGGERGWAAATGVGAGTRRGGGSGPQSRNSIVAEIMARSLSSSKPELSK